MAEYIGGRQLHIMWCDIIAPLQKREPLSDTDQTNAGPRSSAVLNQRRKIETVGFRITSRTHHIQCISLHLFIDVNVVGGAAQFVQFSWAQDRLNSRQWAS